MSATSPNGFDSWHALHMEALDRLDAMESGLASGTWSEVDRGSRWIYAVLRPHNEAEEADLFPLLDGLGATDLRHQLYVGHREMWDLNLRLLTGIDEDRVQDPEGLTAMTQTLVAMIRRHIVIEESTMLPLLQGRHRES